MINVIFEGELRNVSTRGFKKRDGSDGVAYNVLVETKDSSYLLPTCMDVFNDFSQGKIQKGMICNFQAEYEPKFQYNNFTIYGVSPIK